MIQLARLTCIAALAAATVAPADDAVPAKAEPRWWKGNLHTHTFWSDGNDFPEMVAEWYRTNDYNFLALSDHNVLSTGQRWMNIAEVDRRSKGAAMDKYTARFGPAWVETRGSRDDGTLEVRLKPFDEYRALVEQRGSFIMLQAEEISAGYNGKPIHINATNVRELVKPVTGDSVRDVMSKNLQLVIEQEQRTGQAMITHLNHPNFGWAITAEDMAHVVEERFFEVFNGHTGVNNLGDAQRASTEEMWDIACTIRLSELNSPPPFGVATDDSHSYHNDSPVSITGRAWVMVRSTHLTPEYLIRSLRAGDFYASTGVTLRDVAYDAESKRLSIRIQPVPGETFTTRFIGTRRGTSTVGEPRLDDNGRPIDTTLRYSQAIGEVLAEESGLTPSYTLRGDELYVRAVVTSSATPDVPSKESLNKKAWTQPIGWEAWLETPVGGD